MLASHFAFLKYLDIVTRIVAQSPTKVVEALANALYSAWTERRGVFLAGESTCATNARLIRTHLVQNIVEEENSVSDALSRLRLISLSGELSDSVNGNERGFDFPRFQKCARPHDLLIVLSSGIPSPAMLDTVEWANSAGLVTWALTGHNGVKLRKQAQHHLGIALTDIGLVEAIHLLLMQWVVGDVSARIHQVGRYVQPAAPVAAE